jgi:hypothetical protein
MNELEDLARFQDDFVELAFGGAPAASTLAAVTAMSAQAGFAVYRNTLLKGCVDNLAANFPTVMRLVGEPWFRAAALEYAGGEAPTSVSLFDYGTTFPAFLARFPPASELPYLADVARLDKMWVECHIAADALALSAADLAALAPEALGATVLPPHPATRWLSSDQHPAGAIWIANREAREFVPPSPWGGDSVLLTRIDNAVHWRPIDAGAAAFLDACARGEPLQEAAAHALSSRPDLDVAATLAMLLQAGAFNHLTHLT